VDVILMDDPIELVGQPGLAHAFIPRIQFRQRRAVGGHLRDYERHRAFDNPNHGQDSLDRRHHASYANVKG